MLFYIEISFGFKTPAKIKQNICYVWSILAEKLAGKTAELLFIGEVQNILLEWLNPLPLNTNATERTEGIQLAALIALEKFSLTGT